MTRWRDDFVSSQDQHTFTVYRSPSLPPPSLPSLPPPSLSSLPPPTLSPPGYLEEEVKKVNIQLTPGGNVQAPDPQDMIDLEVMIFIALVGVATPPLYLYSQSLRYLRLR